MKITNEIREFLSDKHSTDLHYVDEQADIETDGQNVLVTGIMPNTNQVGQFFVGDLGDIQYEMEREREYKKEIEA